MWFLQPNLAGMERSIGEALGGDEGEKSLARERIEKEEAGSVGEVRHSESSMPTLWKYLELRHRNVREAEFFFKQRQRCGQSKTPGVDGLWFAVPCF